ncbi:hypothetical protein DFH09DRAFT_1153339 [Mycena vulgaris]|nr:hypothetical protein DFH09DRAFT_1153339 [Mycena vulgaris]
MASPFATKLGTNYCPDDGEITQINSLLVEPTLRLERLDGEIAAMQNAIDKLNAERDSLGPLSSPLSAACLSTSSKQFSWHASLPIGIAL